MANDEFDDEFDDDIDDQDFLSAFDQVDSGIFKKPGTQKKSTLGANATQQIAHPKPATAAVASLVLDGLSSGDFCAEPERQVPARVSAGWMQESNRPSARTGLTRANSSTYRQTTLWGTDALEGPTQSSQPAGARVYRGDQAREEPSHHELDLEAMKTWVFPTNLGTIRDYQFSIVKNALFNNTLVALPTGLGKTFIAATVMLNFHRWTKSAKIVFVAPTKPLVAQQIDACYHIAGIPRSETTLLTGDIPPALRVDEWATKRVFFMTPQTLLNDLSHGYADPKSIVLMVIDEAHRAVGEYAYAKVTKLIRRFSTSFRVLALTATPGSKVETVQEILDNLGISHCEIRTEDSIDIQQYVHQRNIDQMVLEPSDEMNLVSELFTEALKPLVDKLSAQNIYYGRNPMALTAYGLMQTQREWFATRGHTANQGIQFMMRAIFGVLTSLAHSIKLLNYHGIKPFYDNLVDFRSEQEGRGDKGSKYKRQLVEHPSFQDMMKKICTWLKTDGFVGHPKLTALADCVLNHFMDRGEGSGTRVIVFSEYRDSAEDIVRMFNKHRPLIKASVFVGQADGKRGEGMKQAQQIATIDKFKKGEFNVLVATSIGEEGLDIGQVDLIVCYDASASPIRMLQRMGRTGRKRAGQIVLLLMKGKEEDQFAKSKDSYEKMQQLICEGSRFEFPREHSKRIVPRDIRPEVDKRQVDIPVENTQDNSLPEPKKRRVPAGKKKPPKKFHMPDGVETGFQTLSHFMGTGKKARKAEPQRNSELDDVVDVPELRSVVLTQEQTLELDRSYRDLPFNHSVVEEASMPNLAAYPKLQRTLQPVVNVKHGQFTKRCVQAFGRMGTTPDGLLRPCRTVDSSNYLEVPAKPFVNSDGEEETEHGSRGGDERQVHMTGKRAPPHARSRGRDSEDEPKRKKRKTADGTAPLRPPREEDVEDTDGDDEETDEPGLPKRLKGRRRPPKGGKAQGRYGKGGINSDELGDDCVRDSDMMESSGSDDGSDLQDFVVADNQATSSMMNSQTTLAASPSSQRTHLRQQDEPFFVPTHFSATQDSEGIPDVETLMGTTQNSRQGGIDGDSEAESANITARTARTARARRQLLDSDGDSDA
ncbi:ATP-dependent DNA helicase mph1 [Drechmeria coniospora]|uniref:ATP-dependent DNA helicase n=1 Tax=Drechmeria coniospora TaxID=98403 RepID=A0A151GKP3_DRECN|nr:ATP-dependent DNA helicase mph1 [Drechmeria coniospora]KYK57670.1 ATP-dependent DNA helicase mph1 [Drechmeria coniospora]